jgi:riboflavin kinase/FMN adenylyltransferase
MSYFQRPDELQLDSCWLSIGSFDGVHIGHQKILNELVIGAQKARVPPVVLTFHPHPATVLRNRGGRYYLTNPDERAKLIKQFGVEHVIVYPFDHATSKISAYDFINSIYNRIHMNQLVVGYDFALGRDRMGDTRELTRIGEQIGYMVEKFGPYRLGGDVISSSAIRKFLQSGDILSANRYLGRRFEIIGEVIHGDGRGRTIGIPTANLSTWDYQILPKAGVYVNRVNFDGRRLPAVSNIGVRPTFKGEELRIETHIIDYQGDLYGKNIHLSFFDRLRDESKFSNTEELIFQIRRDIDSALSYFNTQLDT